MSYFTYKDSSNPRCYFSTEEIEKIAYFLATIGASFRLLEPGDTGPYDQEVTRQTFWVRDIGSKMTRGNFCANSRREFLDLTSDGSGCAPYGYFLVANGNEGFRGSSDDVMSVLARRQEDRDKNQEALIQSLQGRVEYLENMVRKLDNAMSWATATVSDVSREVGYLVPLGYLEYMEGMDEID